MRGALPDRVLSREGHAVAAVREGNLAYGVLPFTVAGPRPVCTALPHFPSLQDCRFSLRSRRRSVNETAESLTNPLTGKSAESRKRLQYSFHSLLETQGCFRKRPPENPAHPRFGHYTGLHVRSRPGNRESKTLRLAVFPIGLAFFNQGTQTFL
jgi:hypothetical protein